MADGQIEQSLYFLERHPRPGAPIRVCVRSERSVRMKLIRVSSSTSTDSKAMPRSRSKLFTMYPAPPAVMPKAMVLPPSSFSARAIRRGPCHRIPREVAGSDRVVLHQAIDEDVLIDRRIHRERRDERQKSLGVVLHGPGDCERGAPGTQEATRAERSFPIPGVGPRRLLSFEIRAWGARLASVVWKLLFRVPS